MTLDGPQDSNHSRAALKSALCEALAAYHGDPHHPVVAQAIESLTACNPTPTPARDSERLSGNWLLISAPIFPDGKRLADGSYCYTLGRLAFNMFQPGDLTVVVHQVRQPVLPIGTGRQQTHDIVVNFTIASSGIPALEGVVRNLGICEPVSDTALQVQFTGGVLEPAKDTDLQQWRAIFENPPSPARSSVKDWLQNQLLKLMLGLVPPKGLEAKTGRVEFKMRRSPKGLLTILYMDEELRITKGQRETVLVCKREE